MKNCPALLLTFLPLRSLATSPCRVGARPGQRKKPFATSFVMMVCALPLFFGVQSLKADTPDAYFGGLQQEMTAEEQKSSGVDALSPAQREYLDAWLRARFNVLEQRVEQVENRIEQAVAEKVEAVREAEREAERLAAEKEREAEEIGVIETRLGPDFTGWSGNTVFVLENGQVWRQRHDGVYRHLEGGLDVRLRKNLFGLWQLKVLSSGRTVSVRRID